MCFDATRRFKDLGRLINHSPVGSETPLFVRGKLCVGMMAVRDIAIGQELTYDYGVRSEGWMKSKTVESSGGEPRIESHDGEDGDPEDSEEVQIVGEPSKTPHCYMRNYF